MNKKMMFSLKLIPLIIISINGFAFSENTDSAQLIEKPIVIVSSSRNNIKNYEKNLSSILKQNYKNFIAFYIDDASEDGTPDLVEQYLEKNDPEKKVIFVKNTERVWILANFYKTIHACNDQAIIAIVDGDDWLAHENVLSVVNKTYTENDVWLTYGNNRPSSEWDKHYAYQIPDEVIKNNEIRYKTFTTAHLRTFYAWLFKKIKLEDLMYKGTFVRVHCDLASMVPMVEMAGWHTKFISEVLYVYNKDSEYNNFNNPNYRENHIEYRKYFRELPRYTPLEKSPYEK